jgi:hypothetical protein
LKPYQIKNSNRFAVLEYLNVSEDINRAWENIKRSIKISAKVSLGMYERKQHKPWFEMFIIFRSNEAGEKAVVTESKPK